MKSKLVILSSVFAPLFINFEIKGSRKVVLYVSKNECCRDGDSNEYEVYSLLSPSLHHFIL